eukprot:Gregarina_sp_Poly_1__402@NODE_109_length_14014_cov_141_998351_g96_i0_p5_GENE_NODE_109_length_14014_cov_141_998351_g96_i0NODE_109_length_14014_cov_141_998351_g96_i0_p5_ORF_typecomplete_len576_score61_01Asn_synthase/PF00733_21/8_4e07Asn_synthase/PF00733_21/1_5e15ThiI/PF02568_14/0_066ThiI/PF02568_14/9_9e03DUF702/PF05142_12/0_066HemolysinCabind/PF00353_19/0_23Adeno_E1A/PF02703_14/0_41_NODE_109_length_14014_cov_141_998351_g96_i06592386
MNLEVDIHKAFEVACKNGASLWWRGDRQGFDDINSFLGTPELQMKIMDYLEPFTTSYCFILKCPDKSVLCGRDKLGTYGLMFYRDGTCLSFSLLPTRKGYLDIPIGGICRFHEASDEAHIELGNECSIKIQGPILSPFRRQIKFWDPENLQDLKSIRDLVQLLSSVVPHPSPFDFAIAVSFSGGLDSTLVAGLMALRGWTKIELLNVSFMGSAAPDRITALVSFIDLCRTFPNSKFRLFLQDIEQKDINAIESPLRIALSPEDSVMDFNIGIAIYFAATGKGIVVENEETALQLLGLDTGVTDLKERLVFVESTVYKRCVFNSSFADLFKRFDVPLPAKGSNSDEKCLRCQYKRKAGCPHQLCRLCCVRLQKSEDDAKCRVHKIHCNQATDIAVDQDQLNRTMAERWHEYKSSQSTHYSEADTIWCGNGADELFGGYGRHRTAELHGSLEGWRQELELDLKRLWKRNLGRDDRCVLLSGRWKCTQYLFLNPAVIDFVAQLPSAILRSGVTNSFEASETKILLREAAAFLGLCVAPWLRKRAIQFGTRSAHVCVPVSLCANLAAPSRRKIKGTLKY